ncbi:hypothetical protein [Lichenifustis flavocetrariae]|uniref:Uncharacterized protein n=1 Tax=Lichenifustis flavocetrariae TaxID=2949735 RepID=A0AA41YY71_9HYPH|nr:hypothetical protein [Lichenifustis flavocetrariae]MCW6509446.1 hypothetical protein [Lichenifustis flavocetrariae]
MRITKLLLLSIFISGAAPAWAGAGDVEYSAWVDCVRHRARLGSTPDGAMNGCSDREDTYVTALRGAYDAKKVEATHQYSSRLIRAVAENPRHS